MKEMYNCPLCNSRMLSAMDKVGSHPVFDTEMYGLNLRMATFSTYTRCMECGLIFQNPRMSDEDVMSFYTGGMYRVGTGSEEKADKDELARARRDADLLKKLGINPKSHLDIGCSRGFFLDTVGADEQVGVEVNKDWTKLGSSKLQVFDKVEDIEKSDFDLVSLIHALEHVIDPVKLLYEAVDHMAYEGRLVIEVPSDSSPGGWPRLAHLYHFEPWVLISILKTMGMKIDYIAMTPHLFIVASIDEVQS